MRPRQFLIHNAIALCVICFAVPASAHELRAAVSLGIGGAGISNTATVGGATVPVERSEGPGVIAVSLDDLLSDYYSIALEHTRGFRLGPFSSGVSFTGFSGRWFFWTPAPSAAKRSQNSTLLLKRFSPFFGLATGVASGTISRAQDQVPEISSSGIYFGYRLGAEYSLAPGLALRPEISYSTTLMKPGQVRAFALHCGLIFFIPGI